MSKWKSRQLLQKIKLTSIVFTSHSNNKWELLTYDVNYSGFCKFYLPWIGVPPSAAIIFPSGSTIQEFFFSFSQTFQLQVDNSSVLSKGNQVQFNSKQSSEGKAWPLESQCSLTQPFTLSDGKERELYSQNPLLKGLTNHTTQLH